ncbi:hypothetical protein [Ensifer sp. 4252]|uniref:hypothetical protein n=1 Tax=Ensifer sp. 4252 TaxID=3373915 RepID=UPI003D24CED6
MKDTNRLGSVSTTITGAATPKPAEISTRKKLFTLEIEKNTALKRVFDPDDVGAGPSTAIGGPAFSPSTQIERENHEQN